MSLAADSAKKEVTAKGAEIEAGSKRIRRKSRDLETDFFGKFLEEAKSEDAAFDEFDTDKSGTIDQEELRAALLKVKITTPPPDAVVRSAPPIAASPSRALSIILSLSCSLCSAPRTRNCACVLGARLGRVLT